MLVVGLTGGIATGKSTVAGLFEELGAYRIDADQLARQVVEPGGPGMDKILRYFGGDIVDKEGQLDRKKMASLVFNDESKRKALENIIHPLVSARMNTLLRTARAEGIQVVLIEVPLLFETNFQQKVNCVIVVSVSEEIQLKRLMERDGFTREQAMQRIKAQMPLSEKAALADYVIDNSGSLTETKKQTEEIWQIISRKCADD